jgi:hypothetical protein
MPQVNARRDVARTVMGEALLKRRYGSGRSSGQSWYVGWDRWLGGLVNCRLRSGRRLTEGPSEEGFIPKADGKLRPLDWRTVDA